MNISDMPAVWNERMARAADLALIIYSVADGGGPLHIVLEDSNLDDCHLSVYDDWASGFVEYAPEDVAKANEAAAELVPLMLGMTMQEREVMVGTVHRVQAAMYAREHPDPWAKAIADVSRMLNDARHQRREWMVAKDQLADVVGRLARAERERDVALAKVEELSVTVDRQVRENFRLLMEARREQ